MKLDTLGNILQRGFNKSYKNAIGLDILLTHVDLNDVKVDFSFWDISMQERLKFFRPSFYRGTSSVVIFFDYNKPMTISPFLTEIIDEIYNSIGPIPIFLIGLNSDNSSNSDIIEQFSEEDYIFYFDFKNQSNFQKEILGYLAEISLNMIQESSDAITTKIRKQFQKYYELKQQGEENFYEVLGEMGLKIIDNSVKILNKYGLFTIDIINGSVIFESLMCENCENTEKCQNKHVIPKKALCIVSASYGWNNLFIDQDKLLILSKILAILEENFPEHVLNQMKQGQKCPEIIDPPQIEPIFTEIPKPEEREIYVNLSSSEIKQRLKFLKTQLWEGRIPASTYVKMQNLLNNKENEKESLASDTDESYLMLREAMLSELKRIKNIMLRN